MLQEKKKYTKKHDSILSKMTGKPEYENDLCSAIWLRKCNLQAT